MVSRVIHACVVLGVSVLAVVAAGACSDNFEDSQPLPDPQGTNHSPVLGHPSATTDQDVPVTFDLLAGASDPDGDPLIVSDARANFTGTYFHDVQIHGDYRTVTVTPAFGFTGTITVQYSVDDRSFAHALVHGTALVTVRPEHAPFALGSQVSVVKDTSLPLTLQAGDADGDPLTFTIVTQPRNGTLSGTAPNLVYAPALGFIGTDSLGFTVSDGRLTSPNATVTFNVAAMNHAPMATPQAVPATEDTSMTITLAGVDPDGDTLSFQVQSPAHGTVVGFGATWTYTPAANYHGSDSFTFTVRDATLTSPSATVTIDVASVNDPPVATALQPSLNEDTSLSITLRGTDADGDALSFAIQDRPQHGTLGGSPPNMTYTPNANYNGPDSFTYTASDGIATSAPATVALSVVSVNDAPVAMNSAATTAEDTPVTIALAATDVDSSTLSFFLVSPPSDGTLTSNGASWTYKPAANVNGVRSFTFKAFDGSLFSTPATITITITPVNDPPKAADDFAMTDPATPILFDVVGNDSDLDGDPVTLDSVAAPAHGTIEMVDGKLRYTPDAGFTGTDVFAYTIVDPQGAAATAQAHVGVGVFPPGVPAESFGMVASSLSTGRTELAPAMSSDGRYIAFMSEFPLVSSDTNARPDVYLLDRRTRALTQVSVSSTGAQGNLSSQRPQLSADGRYVVFESFASNLVGDDTNGLPDVFRHDCVTGETVRISVATGGGQGTRSSLEATISSDGNLVAFRSTAFDLVPDDANGVSDVFVRDVAAGTTTRISVSITGRDADLAAVEPVISGDGRFVAFSSAATNLVVGDTNNVSDVFVRDRVAGTTTRVSVSSTGGEANAASTGPSISQDGRVISFLSTATNLVADAPTPTQLYTRDVQAQITTRPVNASATVIWGRLSGDGRYVAEFGLSGVTIRDRIAGTGTTLSTSLTLVFPVLSVNGRYVAMIDSQVVNGVINVRPNPL
ncbi:MAG TPA: Ig-like domain-containing protein [Kofleriaceae bacterium]|nr:Ig-like domain-containing protein [Kofleriaceae bacterium]